MTKAVEVITSTRRRRRWTRAEKEQIVAAALAPGAVASTVAREAGIHASQLFRWRQELSLPVPPHAAFPAEALPEPMAAVTPPSLETGIEIEFAGGGRMRITGAIDASMMSALMNALAKGKRRR
jgi:transposase